MQISLPAQAATFVLTGGGIRRLPASTENPECSDQTLSVSHRIFNKWICSHMKLFIFTWERCCDSIKSLWLLKTLTLLGILFLIMSTTEAGNNIFTLWYVFLQMKCLYRNEKLLNWMNHHTLNKIFIPHVIILYRGHLREVPTEGGNFAITY